MEQPRVNGHVVDALFCLREDRVDNSLLVEVVGAVFCDDFIDGDGSDGDRACGDDGGTDEVDVSARAEIHDGIRSVADRLVEFAFFGLRAAGGGGVADIGVDLGQQLASDAHRDEVFVVDVGGDDNASVRNTLPDEFDRTEFFFRDGLNLRCDDPFTGRLHLRFQNSFSNISIFFAMAPLCAVMASCARRPSLLRSSVSAESM